MKEKLGQVANSIWMSKMRYGIKLTTHKVRMTEEERKSKDIKATQLAQSKMLRLLDGSRIKDKRSVKDMLEKFNMLSINQTMAEIKLLEAWKANRDEDYPIRLGREGRREGEEPARNTRATNRGEMREGGRTIPAENSFIRDTRRM